jgi:Flp pilus assembly CpaE family ATPase
MEQIKILTVDPDEASQNFLTQMLAKRNYAAIRAHTRHEGMAMAASQAPTLIICETNLGDGTALDFLKDLQSNPITANIPCVVLTGHSDPEEMAAYLQAGFVEYYMKSGMAMMGLVEAIPKLLVTSRKQSSEKQRGLSFVFVSAKGGTGASSLCVNIGMNIAQQIAQSTVAVMDMVMPIGAIADIVGYKGDFSVANVADLPEGEVTTEYLRANLPVPNHWLLHLLPGCPTPKAANKLQIDHIPHIVEALRSSFNYVLIDLGRSLSRISLPIIKSADLIVLVVSTDLSTVTHTKKLWEYFQEEGIEPKKVFPFLNRAVGLEGLTKMEAEKMLGLEIRMTMPYLMGNFTLANNQNTPLSLKYPSDTASMILKEAAIEMSRYAMKIQSR